MNSVQLMGNLAKDVELRYTQTGKPVATFTVAATNVYKDPNGDAKEFTAFVNCVAWGKNGEYMSQFMKGQKVFVQGRLQTRSYEAQDGTKRYVTEVVADFCTGYASQPQQQGQGNFDMMANTEPREELPF
ncbi:single-stranded DNA-binding protein [Veillonella sp. CHU594]|uniref:single-stranded DNA-binding protein n=1 Tax=Veillonella sp. CHU594 TaxID=2490948 RepID=UPI000F8CC962|nr:single-stranded DNA-binding protein [Veillonella sp. CHU594]